MNEKVENFFIRETANKTKILVAKTEKGQEYFFKDGSNWSIACFPIEECPEVNNSNPNCRGKCVNIRESRISKCKDCGKVFY